MLLEDIDNLTCHVVHCVLPIRALPGKSGPLLADGLNTIRAPPDGQFEASHIRKTPISPADGPAVRLPWLLFGSCAGSTPNLAIAGKSVFNDKAGG
jgi:hypothetical protein